MKNKPILIIVLLFISFSSFSQSEYIYRIRVSVSASSCGLCNDNPIRNAYYGYEDASRTQIQNIINDWNWYPYDVWNYITVKVTSNDSHRAIWWDDPTGGGWQKIAFDPSLSVTQTYPYHHSEGYIFKHSV
jgi:hypothetical protein